MDYRYHIILVVTVLSCLIYVHCEDTDEIQEFKSLGIAKDNDDDESRQQIMNLLSLKDNELDDLIKRGTMFRFGKRGSMFRFGKRGTLFRFGKRGGSMFRFGKRDPSFFRYGRDAMDDGADIKRNKNYFRYGRGDLDAIKRGSQNFFRYGRR